MTNGHPNARLGALLVALTVGPSLPAHADPRGPRENDETTLRGDVTLRVDQYDIDGPPSASPYRFDGTHEYVQLGLDFRRTLGPYRRIRGELLALVNDSSYRNVYDGFVVERAAIVYENGLDTLPHRIEAGDTYAYFSHRTLQRPLKGVQLEVQGKLPRGRRQSLQILSGIARGSWRELDLEHDFTSGVSWLVEDPKRGLVTVNLLQTNLEDEARFGGARHFQRLASAAAQITLVPNWMLAEAEIGRMFAPGDEGLEDEDEDQGGNAVYVQLRDLGRRRLGWRLRFDEYESGYRPIGSPIISDRRSGEAHVSWRLLSGGEIRGRFQAYEDERDTLDPLDTTTAGVSFGGPLWVRVGRDLLANIDLFVQDQEREEGSVDGRAATLSGEIYTTIANRWTPRLRLFVQDRDDRTPAENDQSTGEVALRVDRRIDARGVSGTITPGIVVRRVRDGVTASDDIAPTVGFNLARGPHLIQQSLGFERLDRLESEDIDTLSYRLFYRYAWQRDELGFELDTASRRPDGTDRTRSLRAGLFYTHRFELARRPGAPRTRIEGAAPARSLELAQGPLELAELLPGSPIEAVLARLRRGGLGDPDRLGNVLTYERALFAELPGRQRLLLIEEAGALVRAGLVIEPDTSDPSGLAQEIERARRLLLDRYGPPTSVYDQGELGTDPVAAIGSSQVVRILEWNRDGAVLRFGLPRRLDGRLVMELQVAREFPSLRDTLWSIEDARR